MKERQKLTKITAKKYRTARKRGKSKILGIFIEQAKYGRKYAIHALNNEGKIKPADRKLKLKVVRRSGKKRVYPCYYGNAAKDALAPIWEAIRTVPSCEYWLYSKRSKVQL